MTVLKLHIGPHIYHLAHNRHSANVSWMNELITLTLNGDLCDLWQDGHHLDPCSLPLTGAAPSSGGIPSGVSSFTGTARGSSNVCHYHVRGPRTSLDAIPLGWLRSRRKTSKWSRLSLSQCFFICFLSSFLLPSHTHPDTPTHTPICILPSRKTYMLLPSIILGVESKVFSYLKFTVHLPLGRACKQLSGCFYSQH